VQNCVGKNVPTPIIIMIGSTYTQITTMITTNKVTVHKIERK
jgi:hypothetical protein